MVVQSLIIDHMNGCASEKEKKDCFEKECQEQQVRLQKLVRKIFLFVCAHTDKGENLLKRPCIKLQFEGVSYTCLCDDRSVLTLLYATDFPVGLISRYTSICASEYRVLDALKRTLFLLGSVKVTFRMLRSRQQ